MKGTLLSSTSHVQLQTCTYMNRNYTVAVFIDFGDGRGKALLLLLPGRPWSCQ